MFVSLLLRLFFHFSNKMTSHFSRFLLNQSSCASMVIMFGSVRSFDRIFFFLKIPWKWRLHYFSPHAALVSTPPDVWASQGLEMKALFQSIGSLSHCVVSLVNSPGVISAKIRLSIMSNYRQACGPHSVFTLSLTPALRHATPLLAWLDSVKVKVCWEKLCSQFLNPLFSQFAFHFMTEHQWKLLAV